MKLLLFVLFCWVSLAGGLYAQQRLGPITYTAPEGFKLGQFADRRTFDRDDQTDKSYCRIILFNAVPSSGDAGADFRHFWGELVATPYKLTAPPAPESSSEDGWTVNVGAAQVTDQGYPYAALLTVASGHGRTVPIFALYDNEKYAEVISRFIEQLDIEKTAPSAASPPNQVTQPAGSGASGFTGTVYTADGWRREVRPEWVDISQANLNARLHYTIELTDDLRQGYIGDRLWDRVVAPAYEITGQRVCPNKGRVQYVETYLCMAPGRERATGRSGWVVMMAVNESGSVRPVVAFAPTQQAFDAAYPDAEKLFDLHRYNYFPLTAQRLTGTWVVGTGSTANLYNVSTGLYAGMGAASSSAEFIFSAGQQFSSDLRSAAGMVGAMNFFAEQLTGRYQLPSGHDLTLTDAKSGKTDAYSGGMIAIRGGWKLYLSNKREPKLLTYDLVRTK